MILLIERRLTDLFKSDEIAEIKWFLGKDRGFSMAGQAAIILLLDCLVENHVPFEQIMTGLHMMWQQAWSSQKHLERGNPSLEGAEGVANFEGLERLYATFRLPSPLVGVKQEIPRGPFEFVTEGTSYRFGSVGSNDEREINRTPEGISFRKCKISSISLGKCAWIASSDDLGMPPWITDPVRGLILL